MIDTNAQLADFLPALSKASYIALDTEADSLHAYPEKLCLIQIALPEVELLIDPLGSVDLEPLWNHLQGRELIIHGADYDLRLLRKSQGFIPNQVFDTMLAARLLGCRLFGLTDLVFDHIGIRLEKGPQKANWARRPLTPRMEAYAVNDVKYLPQLAEKLRHELDRLGRLSWLHEACSRLISECTILRQPDPEIAWRVKGYHKLGPRSLAVLKELWHWREAEARLANTPPYFIIPPEAMVAVSSAATNGDALDRFIPRRMGEARRARLMQAIHRGLSHAHPPLIRSATGTRPTEMEKRRFQELELRRNRKATEVGIDPTVIASRTMLLALAKDWQEHSAKLMVWQKELLQGT